MYKAVYLLIQYSLLLSHSFVEVFYHLNQGVFFLLLLMPNEWRCYSDMGIPIPKTLVIWASPFHITLAIWIRARVTGDAYITGVLGRGCPCYCNSGSDHTLTPTPLLLCLNRFAIFECFWLSHSLITSLCVLITGFLTLMSIWCNASSSLGFVPKNVSLRKQLATVIRPFPGPFTASSQAFSVNAFWWRVRDERKLARTPWPETHRPRAIMRPRD